MKQVLITGHRGFIGKHLYKLIFDKEVKVIDHAKNSLSEPDSMKDLIEESEIIYHLAGINAGSGYNPGLDELVSKNIESTMGLIKAINLYSKKKPIVVLLSSIHVYCRKRKEFNEETELGPNTPYGSSKLARIYNKMCS